MSDETWTRMITVNLTGAFIVTQVVLPDMIAAGWGRVVNISSMAAQSGPKHMAHYAAAKGGMISMTKVLAAEFGPERDHGERHSAALHHRHDHVGPVLRQLQPEAAGRAAGGRAADRSAARACRRTLLARSLACALGRGGLRHRPGDRRERRSLYGEWPAYDAQPARDGGRRVQR